MGMIEGFVQPVEVVVGGPLPRNNFVQPVEFIGTTPGPEGAWTLLEKGSTVLPNGSGDITVSTPYTPAAGEILVAFVCMDGATAVNVMNDNTNINPGVNDVHWNLRSSGGAIALHLRSGNSGGATVRWAVYTLVAP